MFADPWLVEYTQMNHGTCFLLRGFSSHLEERIAIVANSRLVACEKRLKDGQ